MQRNTFVELVLRQRHITPERTTPTPNVAGPSSQNRLQPSPPSQQTQQRCQIRPPPGFPSTNPRHAPNIPSNAINTSPTPPQSRHFTILELRSGRHLLTGKWTTAFLLADSETGHLFHGSLPCAPWLRNFMASGIEVTDFRVGNQRILPVADTCLYPRFEEGEKTGGWLCYMPSKFPTLDGRVDVEVKRQSALEDIETKSKSLSSFPFSTSAQRMRNEIEICERIRFRAPEHIATYLGVQIDAFGRVTGIAYKRYDWTLLEFVERGYLREGHVLKFRLALLGAIKDLKDLGIRYGIISPENVYLNAVQYQGMWWVTEVVLGGLGEAVVLERRTMQQLNGNVVEIIQEKEYVMTKQVVASVERETVWNGRVFTAEEEGVWEVEREIGERTARMSVIEMEIWMNRRLGLPGW